MPYDLPERYKPQLGCATGGLHGLGADLCQGDISWGLTLGGEVKLLFLLAFFFGHVGLFGRGRNPNS